MDAEYDPSTIFHFTRDNGEESSTKGFVKIETQGLTVSNNQVIPAGVPALVYADGNKLIDVQGVVGGNAVMAPLTIDGVQEVTTTAEKPRYEDGAIYDLQGRKLPRVEQTGVYIVNGRKVLIRK